MGGFKNIKAEDVTSEQIDDIEKRIIEEVKKEEPDGDWVFDRNGEELTVYLHAKGYDKVAMRIFNLREEVGSNFMVISVFLSLFSAGLGSETGMSPYHEYYHTQRIDKLKKFLDDE